MDQSHIGVCQVQNAHTQQEQTEGVRGTEEVRGTARERGVTTEVLSFNKIVFSDTRGLKAGWRILGNNESISEEKMGRGLHHSVKHCAGK